jgi:hypothetical protein
MIQNFRKKPVIIQACQISDNTEKEIEKWSNNAVFASPVLEPSEDNPKGIYWQIKTLEGVMIAVPGDWIIKGVDGEFYPCKPNIFEKTYERIYYN